MTGINLAKAGPEDEEDLKAFYTLTIGHTFEANGIDDSQGVLEEVKHQLKTLHRTGDYVLTARSEGSIIGTIACGEQNRSVKKNIPRSLHHLPEVKGVYVHPDHQGKGIGSLLWDKMIRKLQSENENRACLDSGYRISQSFWTKLIGEPAIIMKDYWGKDEHQMIWFFSVDTQYRRLP